MDVLDLQAAASPITRWELDEAVAAADRCAAASRRLRLPTLPKALVLGVAAESVRGGRPAAERVLAEAVGLAHRTHTCSARPRAPAPSVRSRSRTTSARCATWTNAMAAFRRVPTR